MYRAQFEFEFEFEFECEDTPHTQTQNCISSAHPHSHSILYSVAKGGVEPSVTPEADMNPEFNWER